jgi:carbonic anhydrase
VKSFERLLLDNKAWAEEKILLDANYFKRLEKIQQPEFLWIGCSDSRVPANEITSTEPGEIFVHRNIANLVVDNDLNMLSVLQYAVEVLKVKHVIVCGHYGCGGVRAAMSDKQLGLIDRWLLNIKAVYKQHAHELDGQSNMDLRADRLTELSVQTQVSNLAATSIIQKAWKEEHRPTLHGWVYRLTDGILHNVTKMEPTSN